MPDSSPGTLQQHLAEARSRLIKSLLAFSVASAVCYYKSGEIFDYFAGFIGEKNQLVYTRPAGALMAYMKLSLLGGFVLSSPLLFHQVFSYFRPALGERWRNRVLVAAFFGTLLFGAGVVFALRLLPPVMNFLVVDSARPRLQPMLDVDDYFGFIFVLVLGCGLAFEIPLGLYFLGKAHIVSSRTLRKQWRLAVVLCLILGAIITPTPDVFTMSLVSVPLFLLYLVSLAVLQWVEWREKGTSRL